jgi:hypothetical protein
MPKTKTTPPRQSREKGQRSLDLPEFFTRILTPWRNPTKYLEADTWRYIVAAQPIAVTCRETLISNFLALEWKIEPKDSEKRDELKEDIEYYTEFFQNTGKYEYDTIIEWIGKDLLDIPFGGAAEVGRLGDKPDGRVLWLELIDGGTLFPTLSDKYPVGQHLKEVAMKPIFFPAHAINRVYYSPHTKIHLEGWGIPPPEKIYLALELLNRGDSYYANLLLDTPEAGILDLGDMDKQSAIEWVKAWKTMLGGVDPLKIPVLYEHNNEVKFLPFGKPPAELMFDRVTAKYASIVAAGYGLSLSDIGIQTTTSGGDTLAGSIRDERKTRKTGFARFKKKMVAFFNFMLPDTLVYKIIDMDDELSVALGRARLANATAATQYITNRIFTPGEMRRQAIADGLVTISVPEDVPEDEFPDDLNLEGSPERPGMMGKPVAPSQGGHGEVLPRGDLFSDEIHRVISVDDVELRRLVRGAILPISIQTRSVLGELNDAELIAWDDWHDEVLWGDTFEEIPELTMTTLTQSRKRLQELMERTDPWWKLTVIPDNVYNEWEESLQTAVTRLGEIEYENGKTSEIVINAEDLAKAQEKFKSKIADIIAEINESIPEDIQNCIIAGTKKALIDKEVAAKSLDEQGILHDNKTISYVRQELYLLGTTYINRFASGLTETIKEILGDIENGSTT